MERRNGEKITVRKNRTIIDQREKIVIKLKQINNILNLVGKYIKNDKTNRIFLISSVNVNKYKEQDPKKYLILDKNKVIMSGTEEEIFKMLLSWSVL